MKRAIEQFDDYLEGRLSAEEILLFEQRLTSDKLFADAFVEHKKLVAGIQAVSFRKNFKQLLKETHAREIGNSKVITLGENFARRHGKTIAVAASTAFIAVLSTVAILS